MLLKAAAEFLRQSETSKAVCKRHWATECFFTLNFVVRLILSIASYWYRAKWFTRENCGFNFEALKAMVPEALASVSSASIRDFYRLALRAIDAYSTGLQFGAEEFKQKVYKSHRQKIGRSGRFSSMLAVLGKGS